MAQKWMAILALCAMLCAVPMTAFAAQSQTITSISFTNGSAVAEENLSVSGYGDKDSGYAASTIGGRIYASVSGTDLRKLEWSKGEYGEKGMQPVMTGGTKNPWGNGAYLEVRVPTTGYENITFSASLGGTKKGPRDFKLQYSLDGVNFTDVAGAVFTVPTNKTMYAAFNEVALPEAANNAAMLYIRIAVASNMMIGGNAGLIGGTGGETAINDVTVSGMPIATTATEAVTTSASETTTTTVADGATTTASVVMTTETAQSTQTTVDAADTTTAAGNVTTVTNVKTGDNSPVAATAAAMLAAAMLALTVASATVRKAKR